MSLQPWVLCTMFCMVAICLYGSFRNLSPSIHLGFILHLHLVYGRSERSPRFPTWPCTRLDATCKNLCWCSKRIRFFAWEGSAFNNTQRYEIKQYSSIWGLQGKNCRLQPFKPSTWHGGSSSFYSCLGNFWLSCTRVIILPSLVSCVISSLLVYFMLSSLL